MRECSRGIEICWFDEQEEGMEKNEIVEGKI